MCLLCLWAVLLPAAVFQLTVQSPLSVCALATKKILQSCCPINTWAERCLLAGGCEQSYHTLQGLFLSVLTHQLQVSEKQE